MKIKAYLKPHCGWSNGVRAIMRKHGLEFEDIDIINHRANYEEMVRKSGQPLSPCVEIDGVMLNFAESDTLAVPTHAKVLLANRSTKSPAFLFQIDDAPLQRKCGFYEVFN